MLVLSAFAFMHDCIQSDFIVRRYYVDTTDNSKANKYFATDLQIVSFAAS
jgi:hypothetical protein